MGNTVPLYSNNLSWLSFNFRVLQEAADSDVPLLERLKIFGDLFVKPRRIFPREGGRHPFPFGGPQFEKLDFDPDDLLQKIIAEVERQQDMFGKVFGEEIVPGLKRKGISLLNEQELKTNHKEYIQRIFSEIEPRLKIFKLTYYSKPVFLENRKNYLVFKGKKEPEKIPWSWKFLPYLRAVSSNCLRKRNRIRCAFWTTSSASVFRR